MPFFVFRCLLIACVINLSIGYYQRHGRKGGIVKREAFANRQQKNGNAENEKNGIIDFGNGNNLFGINDKQFGDTRINDWHVGNGRS